MSINRAKKPLSAKLLLGIAILLLLAGGSISWSQHQANRAADKHVAQAIERANNGQPSSLPSTKKPTDSAFAKYTVAADVPRYIFIPKIAVKAIVEPMGLTADDHIQAPGNVHNAGWYTQSAKPGRPGAVIIDGHVASQATLSVFQALKKLATGDRVTVERGDGKKIEYRVVKSQSYAADAVDMATVLAPINPKTPGLNLITCDGKFTKDNKFDKRLVVFAEQL